MWWIRARWARRNRSKRLNNWTEQEFSDSWLQGVKIANSKDYAYEMDKRYPEVYDNAAERVHKFAGKQLQKLSQTNTRVAHIVVTHSMCCKQFSELIAPTPKWIAPNENPLANTGLVAAYVRGKNSRLIFKGNAPHLENKVNEANQEELKQDA